MNRDMQNKMIQINIEKYHEIIKKILILVQKKDKDIIGIDYYDNNIGVKFKNGIYIFLKREDRKKFILETLTTWNNMDEFFLYKLWPYKINVIKNISAELEKIYQIGKITFESINQKDETLKVRKKGS